MAAGTSVLEVSVTALAASLTHMVTLTADGGLAALPVSLLVYAVPGVVIGGQIGSRLQGRVPDRWMERAIASVVALIGAAMILAVVL